MEDIVARRFAEVLIDLSKNHSMSRISTSEIIKESGLGRQTFYNHFHDKYELITWIFKKDAEAALSENSGNDWQEYMIGIFTNIDLNRRFYANAFNIIGQNSLKDYLLSSEKQIYTELYLRLSNEKLLTDEEEFALDFYANGCFNETLKWLSNENPETPEEHAHYIFLSLPTILSKQLQI